MERADIYEKRRYNPRFIALDNSAWNVHVNGLSLGSSAIQDISKSGVQLRYPQSRKLEIGENIYIKLFYQGSIVIQAMGQIIWKKQDPLATNLFKYGVNFNTAMTNCFDSIIFMQPKVVEKKTAKPQKAHVVISQSNLASSTLAALDSLLNSIKKIFRN